MQNLRRGLRRILLVFSIAWVVGSGLYVWRHQTPPSTDYEAEARKEAYPLPLALTSPRPGFPNVSRQQLNAGNAEILREVDDADRENRDTIRWLQIGFLPPLAVFALLESLLWAVRGFSESKT